ncbi:MAG: hypothetical protein SGPRY_010163 [Prymnesium sp.]
MAKKKPKASRRLSPALAASGAIAAVALQLALASLGYTPLPSSLIAFLPSSLLPSRHKEPMACPPEWSECVRGVDLDWRALLELQSQADLLPSPEQLSSCDPTSLLSSLQIAGATLPSHLPPIFSSLLSTLYHSLGLRRKGGHYQPPALFTSQGIRVESLGGLQADKLLLLEGGQWIWPPVEVGHVHELPNLIPGQTTRIVTKSVRVRLIHTPLLFCESYPSSSNRLPIIPFSSCLLQPVVVSVENFLSGGENEHIIRRAAPHMAKSGVALKDVDKGKAAKEFRTSSHNHLPTSPHPLNATLHICRPLAGRVISQVGDALLEAVDRRVMMLTRIPISHAEYIQVLKYDFKEHYSAHHDFFDPAAYASNAQMMASIQNGAKNRSLPSPTCAM